MSPEERLRRFFAPGGVLAHAHPGHEQRVEQAAMAGEVLATLKDGGHLVVEAGTGTGKTLAYLVPAILLGRRVIVSTGTKTLQDQLARKDIPFLQGPCGLRFSSAVVKGRDNYLCRHRLDAFRPLPTFGDRSEQALWPRVEAWAHETTAGDVAELTELPESPSFWPEINARNSTCLGARCPRHDDCFLQEIRRAARAADVIVVNHHLYLADAAVRASHFGEVLPDCDLVVFDEAHRLESVATSFFGRSVSSWRLREVADDCRREIQRAQLGLPAVMTRVDRLSASAASFSRPWEGGEGRFALPAVLSRPQSDALRDALVAARALEEALASVPSRPAVLDPLLRRAGELSADLDMLDRRDDSGWVYWAEMRGRAAFLAATPVDVSSLLRERVFSRLSASVLCSATLAVGGKMAHVRARLGLDAPAAAADPTDETVIDVADVPTRTAVREAIHASPFDHAEQGLLFLPRQMPDPRHRDFAAACAEQARELVAASGGRAFLLFTSHENLRRVHEILADEIQHPILVQGEAPKVELLRRFQEREGSVLFATASFWEGVDVPGPALSLVVIDKLPFAVPTDPIVAARARLLEDAGGNAFRQLSIPEAILGLKQGVGRLIRSRRDRGVIAILDPRVRTPWGRAFVTNLPPFRKTHEMDDVRAFFAAEAQAAGAP